MGQAISQFFQNLFKNKEARILLVGLDAAGKTSILYKLKLNHSINTIPTIGFNVETVQYKKINFTMWDVGGQEAVRTLWKNYYSFVEVVVFVVDSSDRDRVDTAKRELHKILEDELLRDVVVLILANKQDVSDCLTVEELKEKLDVDNIKQQKWRILPCCALTADGLYESLEWISTQL
ncbi:hypothetical protein ABK040_008841 [Willaertia magna]